VKSKLKHTGAQNVPSAHLYKILYIWTIAVQMVWIISSEWLVYSTVSQQ